MSQIKALLNGIAFHQGDTQWYGLSAIPEGAKQINKKFVAASEVSGATHSACGSYTMYEMPEGVVLEVHKRSVLNHTFDVNLNGGKALDEAVILPPKDHNPTIIEKGIYYSSPQTRFDPYEGFNTKVRD